MLCKYRSTITTFYLKFYHFLHLEIILPFAKLCYTFEERLFFSVTIILSKNVILSCLKMNLKISHKLK